MGSALRIFVSYAREDQAAVRSLVEGLQAAGFSVWWDRGLEGGEAFRDAIERQLEAADAVIVVWSRRSSASRWVVDEAEVAVGRGVLVPLRIESVRVPLGFGAFHTLDFSDGFNIQQKSWQELIGAIARLDSARLQVMPRPPISVMRNVAVVTAPLGTVVGGCWWLLYGQRASQNLLGHTLMDSLATGYVTVGLAVLWSAVEVRRAGFASRIMILKRLGRSTLTGAFVALVVLVLAVIGGMGEKSPSQMLGESTRLFVVLTIFATVFTACVKLLVWSVRTKILATR